MREVVSHTFVTLDGVAVVDAVIDTIVELRNTKEVLLAGTGTRLFKDGRAPKYLRLAASVVTSNGVAILTYRREAVA